ncbi:MAG: class I SAM-dependent methyltransferase [Pseudomonadota bacterium]
MDYDKDAPFEVARYRDMQKALPGAEALYALVQSAVEVARPEGGRVLVVGAGGGREIERLGGSDIDYDIVGVDPSADMLSIAQYYRQTLERPEQVKIVQGTINDVGDAAAFDAATSLLVMHFLPDDDTHGGKRAYLREIRKRLKPGALLVHADVCLDVQFDRYEPLFLRQAALQGLGADDVGSAPDHIRGMPVVAPGRVELLLGESGFEAVFPLFQSLWYRVWCATAAS